MFASTPIFALGLKTEAPEIAAPDLTELREMFALGLETEGPQIAAADLSEFRIVKRQFPKDAAERACYCFLLGLMQATLDRSPRTRAEFKEICKKKFRVTAKSFDYVWREAIKATGARWDQPGRRPR
jgi:uncharacterized tellurite resistance protein B-like protein